MTLKTKNASLDIAQRDAAILNTVHASSQQRLQTAVQRRALQEKACELMDIEHFRRLCLADLRQAFHEDRLHGGRRLKYRRLAWLKLFQGFAERQGVQKRLSITALDRQGNYVCRLGEPTQKEESESREWQQLVRYAKPFGITERELFALRSPEQPR